MRCAIYIRVSTKREEQRSSMENQHLLFQQYTAERSWQIVEEYVDIDSGTTPKRENLQRLINDMGKDKFDIILSKELSRLSRNGALSYQIRENALKYNLNLITLDGAINTLENSNEMFGLYTWMYENEAAKTSERTKAALRSRAKEGNFMGSIPPYGYRIENKQLVIREDNTPFIVQRIFQEYLSGLGCDKIASNLRRDKISTPSEISGKSNASDYWYGSTIKSILENQNYTGDLVQSKETTISVTSKKRKKNEDDKLIIVPQTHDAIISKEMFNAVQLMLKNRKKNRPAPKAHLFSNLLFCKDCGKKMHYRSKRKEYICGTYNKRGKDYCTSHVIKKSTLSSVVLEDINELLKHATINYSTSDLKKYIKKEVSTLTKHNRSLQKQLRQVQSKNNSALEKLINGDITSEQYNSFINSDDRSIEMFKTQIRSNNLLIEKLNKPDVLEELQELIYQRHVSALTSTILNLFIEKIEIQDNEHIYIHYKFMN